MVALLQSYQGHPGHEGSQMTSLTSPMVGIDKGIQYSATWIFMNVAKKEYCWIRFKWINLLFLS